jgi:hypothetical protein
MEIVMRRFVLAAFALTVLVACQSATTELTDEQKAEITAEVNMALDGFWDCWRRVDYDGGMAYNHDSPETSGTSSTGRIVMGAANIAREFRPGFASLASQDIRFDETHFKVLAPDAVYSLQQGTYSATDTSGVTGPTRAFAYSFVWIQTEAGWKITAGHMSQGDPATP